MSFGTGFHDIRIIENCLNEGVQFLHEYKEYLKDVFQIEKDYVKNSLSIINKYKSKQDKRYNKLTTSHRAWIVFLGNMEKKCEEKIALLDKYNVEIVEPLKIIINKEEEKKKKQISFYKKLNTFVDRYCQENEKNCIKYHEACDAVMNSKKKNDKKQDKLDKTTGNKSGEINEASDKPLTINTVPSLSTQMASMPSAIHSSIPNFNANYYFFDDGIGSDMKDFDDVVEMASNTNFNDKKKTKKGNNGIKILNPIIKMNNKKNFYVLSLKVANALRNKFYDDDTPYIFDELQSINEEMYQNFKEMCSRQIEYEKELYNITNENNDEILRSLNSINVSKDSEIYLRCYSKEWTKPEVLQFVPTSHWEDKEELIVDSQTSTVLKNMVQKGQERMHKIDLDINSKTSEYKKFEMICNSYDNNSNYSKGEIDIIKNKKSDIMQNIIMAGNIKLICEVQINEISKYLGGNGPKPERQHMFKAKKIINPTVCDYCKEKLWGKAYICKLCTFSCHIKCELKVPMECNGVKTKRKSLRINCNNHLAEGNQNISSPFIKTAKPFGVGNITKIKEEEEEEMNDIGMSDDEKGKNEMGDNSERSLLKYNEKNENDILKNKIYKYPDLSDDKISNPFKEILWYIDNNEFPSITADSLMDMPTISELIKKNSISITPDDLEMLHLRQQRHSVDCTRDLYSNDDSNNLLNCKINTSPTMNSIENVLFNNLSPSSSQYYNAHSGHSTINSSDETSNINEVDGTNETISIIETNDLSSSTSNEIISEDENSNENSIDNTSSDDIYEDLPLKDTESVENYELNPDVHPNPISNNSLSYQLSKSKSLPMLYSAFDSDDDEEEDEEQKERMAIERRNSYLREKFYLKNNISKPPEENFTKMIAMYDYQHQSDDELDLSSNEEVTLIIPDDGSGWAMVSSTKGCGLVPANYLMECAKVIYDYIPGDNESDKIPVKTGDVLLIVEKDNGSGFTKVRVKDREGLIPSTYMEPIS